MQHPRPSRLLCCVVLLQGPERATTCFGSKCSLLRMLLSVTVPEGLEPGDSMLIAAPDGQEFELCVPDGCFGGTLIDVELPIAEQPRSRRVTPALLTEQPRSRRVTAEALPIGEHPRSRRATPALPAMTLVSLTVPDGLYAGMEMNVDWGGLAYTIIVPDGSAAGDVIDIELPALEAANPTGPPPEGEAEALLSFMLAEMSTADDDCPPPPLPPPRLKRPPVEPLPLPEECPHRYKPGQRVHVLRSNGAVTLATVEHGYEMMFDTLYQVRTDDGLMKAAVAEEELSEAPDASPDPWSGFTDFMMGEDEY